MRCVSPIARSFVLLSLLLATSIHSTSCAEELTEEIVNEMAAKLTEVCRKHDVPAMTAAVVDANGLVKSQCFGLRKRGTSDKVELSDRFPLGSCTKSITATLAAVMVDAGKIDWDTSIGDVWPKATDDHLHPKLRDVTLDELLSHQSGLPSNISGQAWLSFFKEKQSPRQERSRMLKLVLSKAPSQPQGMFSYSNLGYVIVAAMLETRARESFESLVKKHIFDPLEMRSADFRSMKSAKQIQPPLLWGHQAENGEPVDPRSVGSENPTVYASCGTVHLSIEDYAKYARWHLVGNPAPVLRSQSAFDYLHEPLVDYTPGAKYACGWICVDTGLGPALNHGGSNTNSFALIWVLPESDFAAVVCTNTGQPQAFPACDEMMSHLMMAHAAAEKTKRAELRPSDPGKVTPERLVGRYQLLPNFIFDVRNDNGRLMVGITNQPTQEVFPDSPTKWSYSGVDATLEFHLRSKGPAYALTLHQNGNAQQAKRVPEPGQQEPRQKAAKPKTSPFTAVRWKKNQPEVKVTKSKRWFTLVSIDGIAASDIVAFSQRSYGGIWQKRFEEDLVEVLTGMKHEPKETVRLVVRPLRSSKTRTLREVAMTEANRQAIKAAAADR